jgi:hypothetical protein
MTSELPAASGEPLAQTREGGARLGGRPYTVARPTSSRFPDLLAELTRAQPLTMLSVAFVAGLFLAWRR